MNRPNLQKYKVNISIYFCILYLLETVKHPENIVMFSVELRLEISCDLNIKLKNNQKKTFLNFLKDLGKTLSDCTKYERKG